VPEPSGTWWHPHPPETLRLLDLHGDHDNAFTGTPTRFSAVVDAPDEDLVHLDVTLQRFAFGPDHRDPIAMQHRPGNAVVRAQGDGQGLGRHAVLRGGQMPGRFEPRGERRTGLVEDRACGHADLVPTGATHKAAPCRSPRLANGAAGSAEEPVRPAEQFDVAQAGVVVGEHLDEAPVRTGVILAREELSRPLPGIH